MLLKLTAFSDVLFSKNGFLSEKTINSFVYNWTTEFMAVCLQAKSGGYKVESFLQKKGYSDKDFDAGAGRAKQNGTNEKFVRL